MDGVWLPAALHVQAQQASSDVETIDNALQTIQIVLVWHDTETRTADMEVHGACMGWESLDCSGTRSRVALLLVYNEAVRTMID